ncbi:16S rRNA (guanine(527)-N(7))-methyltransferase RsmG [Lactiplantibacillus fabifermentans]|uniref:Ribosomal RNA small subunit methyltransferase G n=2 Tax=Lactiplantibacillus fabifermentans TaxID=483011 RepID=A0A0R2NBJ0_9LACO|nr:16S rRNA (guanine(527)-N(7))-methyltransferase RsmG [Lactiplantibacillus fabifermentans]ETY73193.1 16S rRNA methyltransferase [Lactiplantibacillus fabifermentans T30PCM01]KRO23233.1 ribosomal rna small subunit methyltransferase g [Lactiplantibacillus fabifermentans DSM 21115]
MNPTEFKQALASHGIMLDDHQMAQFATYFKLLIETNRQFNLTTITAEPEVYLKHFYDSITPAFYVPALREQPLTLCDVGAGAGFPSLPLKICFPQLQVTIVDSLNKRINFLQQLVRELGLTDVRTFHDRAETFAGKKSVHREAYDLVTARAVARLSVLSELCLPLVKVGGQMVALKAANARTETAEGEYAVQQLGGKLVTDEAFTLPETGDPRHIIVIDKKRPTPKKYPRKPGTPAKQPLTAQD